MSDLKTLMSFDADLLKEISQSELARRAERKPEEVGRDCGTEPKCAKKSRDYT
jgi:hypothetical protein